MEHGERGAETLELDVITPSSQLRESTEKAVGIHGKIDVGMNSAGYMAFGALEGTHTFRHLWPRMGKGACIRGVGSPQETLDQFNTNSSGGLNVTRASLLYMCPRNTGKGSVHLFKFPDTGANLAMWAQATGTCVQRRLGGTINSIALREEFIVRLVQEISG